MTSNNFIKSCIRCGTDNKEQEYPMCYNCFLKWDKEKNNPKEVGYAFLDDDDD